MSWETERSRSGKLPWNWIELAVDKCTRTYGVSPCTAGRSNTGTLQSGGTTTVRLASGASAVDDAYNGMTLRSTGGTGSGQERRITDYVGATRDATVESAFSPALDGTTTYDVINRPAACVNGWETCQDRENFLPADYWLRFSEPNVDVPRKFVFADPGVDNFIPILQRFTHDPSVPAPGESIGLRVRFTADLQDVPHHDFGIDPYIRDRGYNGQERSTLLRKLKARYPHYVGRKIRWYQGYINPDVDIITDEYFAADYVAADYVLSMAEFVGGLTNYDFFRRRQYVMEKFTGPDGAGKVTILANDVLKLLDAERAQAPLKSTGALVADLDETTAYTTIDVTTANVTEYDLLAGDTVDYVRVGDEIFRYTGKTAITGGVQLTGVTRSAPFPYTTAMDSHKAGDNVQRCRFFRGTVPQVVRELMVTYGGIDPSFIPTADWNAEATTWAPETIERLVTEPEGVKDLIDEIIGQTMTWGFWFDDVDQQIKYLAVRPPDPDTDTVVALTDEANLVAGSVRVTDLPDLIINEVQVLFGQIDPVGKEDDIENYRRGHVDIETDSQSANELDQKRVKRIYARWWPATSGAAVEQFARRTINARAKNVVDVEFRLERKDENVKTAQFCDLTTLYLIDALGLPVTTRLQVIRAKADGEEMTFKAREVFFRGSYGRWAPSALDGLLWTNATDAQQEKYLFWAQSNGTFTNGDRGKVWL